MNEHTIELRVTYKDTDQMGVMYYSNYLVWFEIARTEYFRDRGVVYKSLEDEQKIYLPVIEARCVYRAPLKYDDVASVTTRLAEVGKSRLTFEYEVKRDGKVTTAGLTRHVFINEHTAPIAVPEELRKALTK